MASIGRGRGRGRGLKAPIEQKPIGMTTNQQPNNSPAPHVLPASKPSLASNSSPASIKDIIAHNKTNASPTPVKTSSKTVKDITEGIDCMTCSEVLDKIPPQLEEIKSEKNVERLVEIVCERALEDPDFAATAAKLCDKIWRMEQLHNLIRNPLLTIVQRKYSSRGELRKKRKDSFYGYVVFLCELYKLLRLRDQPLKPLTSYVCQILKELLGDDLNPSADDVLYFYQELESVGGIIQQSDQGKIDDLMNVARLTVISSKIQPSVRCRLVQLIELYAANWKMRSDINLQYEDLQQDLISEE